MNLQTDFPFIKGRTAKLAIGAFATIFLGAIGSGLWNLVLSHLFDWLMASVLTTTSNIFHSYVDTLHRNVGKGTTENFSTLPFLFILTSIICSAWFLLLLLLRHIRRRERFLEVEKNEPMESISAPTMHLYLSKAKRRLCLLGIPMAMVITVMYSSSGFEAIYNWKACIFAERAIEIISPHISSQKFLELRSMYRSVNDAKKFYALEDTLRQISNRFSVELPQFSSIR
jgi:hypothetical protein